MYLENFKSLTLPLLAVTVTLTAGCATTKSVDELRAKVDSVERTAIEAKSTADNAQRGADDALTRADRAQATADEAQNCCVETNEKIDRMFQRSMSK